MWKKDPAIFDKKVAMLLAQPVATLGILPRVFLFYFEKIF